MLHDSRPAAIYVRISEDREGSHLGVDRQREDCEELATRLNWRVVEVYVDNDISAYSGKRRPDYEELLADLRSGRIRGVLAWHTDRLHRAPVELEEYIEATDQGVLTHTVKAGELDLNTPSGRMVARILGAQARYESEHRGERVAAARLQRTRAGKWGGGIRPFGWDSDGVTIRPSEAAEIVSATDSILAGGSLRSIAHGLNERGITSTTGRAWTSQAVKDMLVRPRNAGKLVSKGEVIGDAPWPALVPEGSWQGLRLILEDPARRVTPGNALRWLGSHLYVCGTCGSNQVVCSTSGSARKDGKPRKPSYRCRSRETVGTSHHFVRDAEKLDNFVTATVLARLERPDARELVQDDAAGGDADELHSEALGLRQRLTDLSDAFADGEVTRAQLASGTKRIQERLAEVEAQIGRLAKRNPLTGLVGVDDMRIAWEKIDLGRRRAVLDTLMTVTIWKAKRGPFFDPDSVDITWKR